MGPKRSGKKWHHHETKRPRKDPDDGNSGGNDSGEQRPKKPRRAAVMNLGNVKGHQAVVATCDIRNDRQATAELVDLLNAVADDMYPADAAGGGAGHEGSGAAEATASSPPVTVAPDSEGKTGAGAEVVDASATAAPAPAASTAAAAAPTPPEKSVEDMIREEADELRSGAAKTHRFKSVNTTVKGVVMVCVTDPKVDVLRLVDALYAEIRTTKARRSRFLERVTPLQVTAYPELEAFREAAEPIVSAGLPPVADGVPPLPVEVRPTAAGGKKAEARAPAAVSKEEAPPTAEAGAAAAAPGGGAIAEKGEAGEVTNGNGGKAGADHGKQQATAAAAAAAGQVFGNAATSGGGGGGNKLTSDKRWKFRVDIRRRNSALKRPDLINAVVGSVGEGHSVSMSSPEVTIVIEAVKSVVGASVLFNYALNHEYSISRLQDAVCGAILDN